MIPKKAAEAVEEFLRNHNLIPQDSQSPGKPGVDASLKAGMEIPITAKQRSQLSAELVAKHRIRLDTLEAAHIFTPTDKMGDGIDDVAGYINTDALLISMMSGSKDPKSWSISH